MAAGVHTTTGQSPSIIQSSLESENRRLRHQIELSRAAWIHAAKEAFAGRDGELRNRVALAETTDFEIVR